TMHSAFTQIAAMVGLTLVLLITASGQATPSSNPTKDPSKEKDANAADTDEQPTIFPHSQTSRLWISGQMNFVFQYHPPFHSPYSGPNSLKATPEAAVSRVMTLYTGYEVAKNTEVFFDLESAGGRGISEAFGLAGFTNLDVVRNPT